MREADLLQTDHLDIAEKEQLLSDHFFLSQEDLFPDSLLTAISVLIMDDETFQEWLTSYKSLTLEELEDSPELVDDVFSVMLTILRKKDESYDSTFDEDFKRITDWEISPKEMFCARIRFSERRLIHDFMHQIIETQQEENEP